MLADAKRGRGLAVHFKTSTLPWFILWKNCGDIADGYVAGLEPATNFPNPRGFEQQHDRVVSLDGGKTASFRVTLSPLSSRESVQQATDMIRKINDDQSISVNVSRTPRSDWSTA